MPMLQDVLAVVVVELGGTRRRVADCLSKSIELVMAPIQCDKERPKCALLHYAQRETGEIVSSRQLRKRI